MEVKGISYDEILGIFYNKSGKQIGSYTRSYGRLCYRGKDIKLHRLAFYLKEGNWPEEEVDHINGNKHDNRWCNLRKCSRTENIRNTPKRVTNKSGYKGVWVDSYKGKFRYRAKIHTHNRNINLGSFKTAEEAAKAYDKAALQYHGDFANLNFKGN